MPCSNLIVPQFVGDYLICVRPLCAESPTNCRIFLSAPNDLYLADKLQGQLQAPTDDNTSRAPFPDTD